MNFFEQEMRSLFEHNDIIQNPKFCGKDMLGVLRPGCPPVGLQEEGTGRSCPAVKTEGDEFRPLLIPFRVPSCHSEEAVRPTKNLLHTGGGCADLTKAA